jgi:hypothetical protein
LSFEREALQKESAMKHRYGLRLGWVAALVLAGVPAAFAREQDPQRLLAKVQPPKGRPFAGAGYMAPYERVLDHGDLVLVGKLTQVQLAGTRQSERIPGRFDLDVEQVLKGEHKGKQATVHFGGAGPWDVRPGRRVALICIRADDGRLILAGDPNEGGGFVREGPEIISRMIQAAADPQKGYQSKDPAVKLSSAYRLAMAYAVAPAGQKPALPSDLIPTLIDGLYPHGKWRGTNVNAAARDALNVLLDCNITMMWLYSVYHGTGRRTQHADTVRFAWERTVKQVKELRTGPPQEMTKIGRQIHERRLREAREMLPKLVQENEIERQKAAMSMVSLDEPHYQVLAEGLTHENAAIVRACRDIRRRLFEEQARTNPLNSTFDPAIAQAFIPVEADEKPEQDPTMD